MTLYKPQLLVAEDDAAFAQLAADTFVGRLSGLTSPLVTLPTGMTPLGMYQTLTVQQAGRRDLWDQIRFIALDEYSGLSPDDERLFGKWLSRAFLDAVNIKNRTMFDSMADPETEATRIKTWLQQHGPLDLAVLGLGGNGHVAFNEPGTPFESSVHAMVLTAESIKSNARYWGHETLVPRHGVTLGLKDLASARQTLLLVNGAGKADILKKAFNGPVTTGIPASYLQTTPNVTIIADRAAASRLSF